jgi:hypothetical protein
MKPKIGETFVSTVDATAVVVVRCAGEDIILTCGGREMVPKSSAAPEPSATATGESDGTQMGKRYTVEGVDIELLCVKPGTAALAVNGRSVTQKTARPLPASD